MTDFPFGTGALEPTPDARDFVLELPTAPKLPSRYVCTLMPPVLNQGSTPTCVAHAATGMKQWQERRDGHGFLPFDPMWLYRQCKALDGNSIDGTTGRQAMRVLKAKGEVLKGTTTPVEPIAAYYAVPLTLAALKAAVFTYGPVSIGGPWPESWFYPVKGIMPAPSSALAGGHERLLIGWDDSVNGGSVLERNSWGRFKGSVNGNEYVAYRWLLPRLWEAWKSVDRIESNHE